MENKKSILEEIDRSRNLNGWIILLILIWIVLVLKLFTLEGYSQTILLEAYSICLVTYVLSRIVLAYFYEIPRDRDQNYEPSVFIIVPCKNEEENISKTIRRFPVLDYPKDKLEVLLINDGSTDNTLSEIKKTLKVIKNSGLKIKLLNWKVNKGKRYGLATGIKRSKSEIIVVIDSDSFVEKNSIKELVRYFTDPMVGAVAAHTDVYNHDTNVLTRMQDVRYWISFKAHKSAEALFGSVTCCPGCCSAYRRAYVMQILGQFLNQRFLGARCTYGDDRSLTNFILSKGYKCLYAPEALAYTIVPDNWETYLRQQFRWKKSWTKETLMASKFMWKKNPIASASFYLSFLLTLVSPIVIIRNFFWIPIVSREIPYIYFFGISVMALIYATYFFIHKKRKNWMLGALLVPIAAALLIWQFPWALINLRDNKWGTR